MRSDEQTIMNLNSDNPSDRADDPAFEELLGQMDTRGPLPPSPRLKCRRTGIKYIWTPSLAELGEDAFINCDEAGNEDPAAWTGRYPKGMNIQLAMMREEDRPALPPREVSRLRPPEAVEPAPIGAKPEGATKQRKPRKPKKNIEVAFDPALGLPPGQAAAFGVDPVPAVPELDDFEKALAGQAAFDEALRNAAL